MTLSTLIVSLQNVSLVATRTKARHFPSKFIIVVVIFFVDDDYRPCRKAALTKIVVPFHHPLPNRIFELIEKQLPPTESQAVRFQYRDGLDAIETAEKMSVRRATIRGYVSEGPSRIRRLLKDIRTRTAE